MTERITVTINGEPHEVEAKPLTLLFHNGPESVEVSDSVTVDPIATVRYADNLSNSEYAALASDPTFRRLFALVWGDVLPPATRRLLRASNLGIRHTVGMICIIASARFHVPHRRIFLRLPESYLHPKQQVGLADLLIVLTKPLKRNDIAPTNGN